MAFKIISSGIYLPENPWPASKVDQFLGLASGTVNNKNGLVCKKQDSGAGYGYITIPC